MVQIVSRYRGLRESDYMSSASLPVLDRMAPRLKIGRGAIVLGGFQDDIRESFEISGGNTSVLILGDMKKALVRLSETKIAVFWSQSKPDSGDAHFRK